MIPIVFNHDYSQQPVGYLDKDGKIKLRKESGITVQQLVDAKIGYVAKKVVNGVVVEAELTGLSLRIKDDVPEVKVDPNLASNYP